MGKMFQKQKNTNLACSITSPDGEDMLDIIRNSLKNDEFKTIDLRGYIFEDVEFYKLGVRSLVGINFSGATFIRCNFEKLKLSYTKLIDSLFEDCNFFEKNGLKFVDTTFENTYFKNCKLNGCIFTGNLKDTHFENCCLEMADFSGSPNRSGEIIFKTVNLSQCQFTNCEGPFIYSKITIMASDIHKNLAKYQSLLEVFILFFMAIPCSLLLISFFFHCVSAFYFDFWVVTTVVAIPMIFVVHQATSSLFGSYYASLKEVKKHRRNLSTEEKHFSKDRVL